MGVDLPRAGLLLLLLALPRSAASVPSSRTFIPASSLRRGRDSLPTRVFNRRTGFALVAAAQDGRYQHSNSNSASSPTGAASTADLPASFDSRTAWPGCASIAAIYDQGTSSPDPPPVKSARELCRSITSHRSHALVGMDVAQGFLWACYIHASFAGSVF